MNPMRGKNSLALALFASTVAAISILTYADDGSPSSTAGVKQPSPSLSVGVLAKMLVSEVALNSPTGGYSETSSLGIMRAVGYDPKRSSDAAATVADLKAMLSSLGVESATKNPQQSLTARRVADTLAALRSTMPRFTVPVSDRERTTDTGPAEDERPGPCQIAKIACKARCSEASPSGTGDTLSGCVQACNDAFEECRRRLFSSRPGNH